MPGELGTTKEIRLALVCYGGVSLAIYMHGITKELQKLVVASTAFDSDRTNNPFTEGTTEQLWWNFFENQANNGVSTRVVVDIISGTSAGGINGVCLAKALSVNRSQDGLTRVWLEKGDLRHLVRGPKWLPIKLRAAWFGVDLITRPRRASAPLHGDLMSKWLVEAFDEMDSGPPALGDLETLVPADQSLDLFVPVTDFRGRVRDIPLQSPKWMQDHSHRHIFSFRHEGESSQFTQENNAMLSFAARATSSFPGGFPPISMQEFQSSTRQQVDMSKYLTDFFPHYTVSDENPFETWFIDGGVLDNAPFGTSIDAIYTKQAATEVDRRVLYIEPDPAIITRQQTAASNSIPDWPKTVWAGLAGIPRQEPIIDDLLKLQKRNNDVMQVRDVIESSFETIRQRVRELVGVEDVIPPNLAVQDVEEYLKQATLSAAQDAGFGASTYARLRVHSVIDGFSYQLCKAARFPSDTFQADFVTDLMRAWASQSGLFSQQIGISDSQLDFMKHFDVGYSERHLRFLISGLNWWYRGGHAAPPRTDLDKGKRLLYTRLKELKMIVAKLIECDGVQTALQTVFDRHNIRTLLDNQESMDAVVKLNRQTLDNMHTEAQQCLDEEFSAWKQQLHTDVIEMCNNWEPIARRDVFVRYIGFPFWDVVTFPVQVLSGVNERDGVEVARLSPRDVYLLNDAIEGDKLAGTSFHHFGAFFSRAARENDYLWGRLDAIERLVSIITDDPAFPSLGPPNTAICAQLFRAVINEERSKLTHVHPLMDRIMINELLT